MRIEKRTAARPIENINKGGGNMEMTIFCAMVIAICIIHELNENDK